MEKPSYPGWPGQETEWSILYRPWDHTGQATGQQVRRFPVASSRPTPCTLYKEALNLSEGLYTKET